MALGRIGALKELGKSIPGDLFVVGFDKRDIARFTMRPVTTLHLPILDMRSLTVEPIAEGAGGITSSRDPVEGRMVPHRAQARLSESSVRFNLALSTTGPLLSGVPACGRFRYLRLPCRGDRLGTERPSD